MSFTNALLLRRSSRPGAASSSPAAREGEVREKLGRVVLADSESADLEHMASILRGMGFTVVTAQDGRSAMGLIRRHSPVLVLATLDLPILNGYMLAQKLREHPETENTPFMFILRAGEIPDQMVGHETFAHDYIQKPFSIQEFKRRVLALLNLVQQQSIGKVTAQEKRPFLPPASQTARSALEWLQQLKTHLEEMSAILDHLESRLLFPGTERRPHRPEAPEEVTRKEGGTRRPVAVPEVAAKTAAPAVAPAEEPLQMVAPGLDSQHKHVLLEKLRAEFRSRSQAAAGATGGEKAGGTEDHGGDWPFDPGLLSEAERGSHSVPLAQVETEEMMQFPRASMLSVPEEEVVGGRDTLYGRLRAFVLKALRRASLGAAVEYRLAEDLATLLQATRDLSPLLQEATRRDQEFSVSGHAANVTVLALCVAREYGCDEQAQFRIALAGLLHELGVVRLPERLVFKEQPLSEEEMRQLRRRPLVSAVMLREAGRPLESVVEIVGQVFEREDGSGHPLGLFGSEMREEAKLLALADVFEACIHRRPYRKPLSGYSTLFQLSQSTSFSRDFVKALVRAVSIFPLHELLQLTTGEIVEVVAVNPASLSRPRVRVRFEASGSAGDQRELDLSRSGSPEVKRVLTAEELPAPPDVQSA